MPRSRAKGRTTKTGTARARIAPARATKAREAAGGGTIAALGEFALIDRLKRLVPSAGPGVILGIGDDAAVLHLNSPVLATCDVQVEGVHFTFDLGSPADIGWRALAVNLSDIAAMGGVPRHALVSLLLPATTAVAMLEGVYQGLAEAASAYGVTVVGGNVARTTGPLVIDVTLLGEAAAPLRRDGARAGDGVWVTGSVGKAAGGLFLLRHPEVRRRFSGPVPRDSAPRDLASHNLASRDPSSHDALVAAYRRPVPRVAAGQALAATGFVSAMVDTSDGTAADLLHVVEASNVGVSLDARRLPLAEGLRDVAHAAGVDPAAWALGGGEDYELLFTAPPVFEGLAAGVALRAGVPITRIGDVLPPRDGRWLVGADGSRTALVAAGWDHFSVREG